jgi:hypothetical protein
MCSTSTYDEDKAVIRVQEKARAAARWPMKNISSFSLALFVYFYEELFSGE